MTAATQTQSNLGELYHSALEQYESALKTGLKIQEESIKLWGTWAKHPPLMPDWTQKAQTAVLDTLSSMPQRFEESMRLLNEQSQRAMEMLHKGFDVSRSTNVAEAQEKVHELWEMSLGVLRNNMHSLLKAQSQAMQKWEEAAGCTVGGPCESAAAS
jgi:polyhydroxyalkanoate synthesis regulator phasin